MALFLLQGSYNATAAKAFLDNPQDRQGPVSNLFSSAGGKLHHMWLALGETDYVIVGELPDAKAAMAMSIAVNSSGNLSNFRISQLLTTAEAAEAMKSAASISYSPPTKWADQSSW